MGWHKPPVCHPREGGDPALMLRCEAALYRKYRVAMRRILRWIPAFAGMTSWEGFTTLGNIQSVVTFSEGHHSKNYPLDLAHYCW